MKTRKALGASRNMLQHGVALLAATTCLAALPCLAAEPMPTMTANPGFEAGTNGWQIPNALWRIEDGSGRKGSKCLVYENNDQKRYLFPRHPLALDAGGIYRYGAWVKVDARPGDGKRRIRPKVSLDFADAAGKWIGAYYASPVGKPDADGWVRYEGVTRPLASAVVSGNLFGFMPRGGTGRVRFDDFFISCEEVRHVDTVVSSAYRDTATEGTVSFVATLFVNPAKMPLETLSATFAYRNADGVEAEVPAETLDSEHAAVKLDVARFAAGTHPVTFVLRTKAGGRELGRAACSFTRAAVPRRVAFDRFGRTLVDGKPFFPLGMYARDVTPEALAIYTNGTPYNCIMPYHMPSKEMLDACRDAGLMVICSVKDVVYGVNEDRERFRSREDSFAHIAGMVRAAKEHPATLAWYANDESPLRQIDTLRDLKHMIHELDPDHPVWHVTNKPGKVRPFLGSYDVIGRDPYPIGLSGGAYADIGRAATDALMTREATYDTVPMWHVPQAFNWAWQKGYKSDASRYPTADEIVSMTWQPIAAGANGLIYYAFHRICMATKGAERDECLRRAAAAAAEVKAKMPILLSEPGPVVLSAPKGIVCRTWRSAPGVVTLLVVNTTREAVSGTVTLADGLPPQTVELPPLGHVFIEITTEKRCGEVIFASAAYGAVPPLLKTGPDRNATQLQVLLKKIGCLRPKNVREVGPSNFTIDGAPVDRDFVDFDKYRDYLVPLGVNKIRILTGWAKSEREKGKIDVAWLDHIVDWCLAHDIEPLLELSYGNPIYPGAGGAGLADGIPNTPEGLKEWDRWVDFLANHFKGRVKEWAMWNEPDLKSRANNTPSAVAAFNVRSAKILKKHMPDCWLHGLSLASPSPEMLESCIKPMGDDVKLFDTFIYHGYSVNPDRSYETDAARKAVLAKYAPHAKLRQGENGAASEFLATLALSRMPWSELGQAKYDLRRALGDLGHDLESGLFCIVDINYAPPTFEVPFCNRKGYLRLNSKNDIIQVKRAYYAIQNMVSVFNSNLVRVPEKKVSITDPVVALFEYRSRRDEPLFVFWEKGKMICTRRNGGARTEYDAVLDDDPENGKPGDSLTTREHIFEWAGQPFKDPVWVDLITGWVYEIPSENQIQHADGITFVRIPVYDSPCFVTERAAIDML